MSTEIVETFDYSSLGEKAGFVRGSVERIKSHAKRAVESLVEIGLELIGLKPQIEHGQFIGLLDLEFQWSIRTAQRYMQAADIFKDATVSHFTANAMYLLSSPSVPESAIKEAKDRAEAGELITKPIAAEIKDRHLIDEPYEPEEGGNDPAEDATEPCEQPGEPQVNEIDLSGDDEPVQSPGVLRRRRARAADLQAEADVAIAKMIEAWPVEDWEELLAWVKGVARQIKEGND